MPALDAVKAFWILGIFLCMFFWLPTRLFSGRPNFSAVICMAGNWARMVLCVTIFVFLLSGLKVFGAITVVLLFLGAIIVSWFRKRTGMSRRLLTNLQATTINLIRHFESRSFGRFLVPGKSSSRSARPSWASRVEPWLKMLEGRELLGASLVVVLATSAVLRTEHAVRELRFDQPEQYSALLRARQLMLNIHPAERPVVFPAMIATTSFLSSTDPMQVTRFLTPAIGLLLVLATGLLVQVSARDLHRIGTAKEGRGCDHRRKYDRSLGRVDIEHQLSCAQQSRVLFRLIKTQFPNRMFGAQHGACCQHHDKGGAQ